MSQIQDQIFRSKPFIETRKHHSRELAEDYVEIIHDLINAHGEARICDIAEALGVSHVTAIRALERLEKSEYLIKAKNKPITLTSKGKKLAITCKKRHEFLLRYLTALGVPESVAKIDVEGMEHHISKETMQAFEHHLSLL